MLSILIGLLLLTHICIMHCQYNILNPVAPNNISNPSKIPIIEDHGPVTGSADTVRPFGNSTAVSGTQFKFNFPSSLKCLQPSLASSGDVQVILGPANVSGDIFVVTKSVGTSSTPIENIIYNWNSYISSTESRTNGLLYFRLANVICLQDFEVHSLKFHSMNQQQFNHSIILIIGFRSGSVVARLMDKNSFRTISEISLVGINCLSIVGKTVSRAADINIDACITAISLGGNESISDSHPMGSDMPPVESSNDAVPNMVEVYFRLYGMRDQIILWKMIQNSPTPLVDGTNPLRDEDSCLQYLMLSRVDNQYMSKLSSPLNHISLSSGGAVLRHVDRWCYRYQYILFIDDDGFLKYISHGTASNFPGPQYPPGYNLIQQVIPYIETEDEFDCVTSVSADESPKRIELGDLVISIGNFQNESKSATWLDVPSHNHQFANLLKSSYEVENIGNVPTVVIDSIPPNNDNDNIKKHSRLFLSDILPVPRKITNGDFIVSQTKDLEVTNIVNEIEFKSHYLS